MKVLITLHSTDKKKKKIYTHKYIITANLILPINNSPENFILLYLYNKNKYK